MRNAIAIGWVITWVLGSVFLALFVFIFPMMVIAGIRLCIIYDCAGTEASEWWIYLILMGACIPCFAVTYRANNALNKMMIRANKNRAMRQTAP